MKMIFVSMNGVEEYNSPKEVPYKITDYMPDLSEIRNRGGFCRSELLDNQPIYEGFLTPMLDGGCLRYETAEVCDMLSR